MTPSILPSRTLAPHRHICDITAIPSSLHSRPTVLPVSLSWSVSPWSRIRARPHSRAGSPPTTTAASPRLLYVTREPEGCACRSSTCHRRTERTTRSTDYSASHWHRYRSRLAYIYCHRPTGKAAGKISLASTTNRTSEAVVTCRMLWSRAVCMAFRRRTACAAVVSPSPVRVYRPRTWVVSAAADGCLGSRWWWGDSAADGDSHSRVPWRRRTARWILRHGCQWAGRRRCARRSSRGVASRRTTKVADDWCLTCSRSPPDVTLS